MRRRLMGGLFAVLAGVMASMSGLTGAGASPGSSSTLEAPGIARPGASTALSPGSRVWVARYNGPGNGNDIASAVAVGPGGATVFVTGSSAGTTKNYDYGTVAYSAATGARLWVARYNGPANGINNANALAVSPSGAMVFVTGDSQGAASGLDYATVAYSAATGTRVWAARYHGRGNGNDSASSIAVSPSGGTVFVTGSSQGAASGADYATVAYSAATGARLWVARYNGPGNGDDAANSVAVSPSGQTVFVTGESQGAASSSDYATVAYNAATGARLWVKRYNGPGNGNDFAGSIRVSPSGQTVFVTGSSAGSTSGPDYATVAYSAATGARLWVARYNGPGNLNDEATSVAIAPDGEMVFVTGVSYGGTSGEDYATIAYSATTGARLWVSRYNGPGNGEDVANAAAISPDGATVYVTGGDTGTNNNEAYATVAYNAATGAQQWVARYVGPAGSNNARALAVSPDGGTVFVTGLSLASGSGYDYATVAYHT